MTRIAAAVLAAIALTGPAPALAAGQPADPRHAKPSSYAPSPHSGPHVYGSPIETAGTGQTQEPRHKHASAKRPAKAAHAAHDHKVPARRSSVGA
jgi:hypothetical protein